MVLTQTKPVYNSDKYGAKDKASCKKEQFAFKGQDRKDMSKSNGADKKPDAWGKIFKNEQHFKSLHIC